MSAARKDIAAGQACVHSNSDSDAHFLRLLSRLLCSSRVQNNVDHALPTREERSSVLLLPSRKASEEIGFELVVSAVPNTPTAPSQILVLTLHSP